MKEENQQAGQKKYKDIARIDQEAKRTHGWYVRVRFQGKTKSKFFSDKKQGSRDTALMGAVAWRDSTEKKIGKLRTDRHIVTVSRSKSRTGVVGVRLNKEFNRYEVSWVTAEGRQKKTSISIRKHGREAAFIKACTIRQEKEQERHQVLT